jgi:hypothetical protein
MIERISNYWRVWRSRGAARMDHGLWLHWAVTGKYPRG